MRRAYIEGMIHEIVNRAHSPNVWGPNEYEVRDYRGTVEVGFAGFADFCEFVNAVEGRGWVATIKPDARRLLFGVTFDIPAGEDHAGLALFVSVRAMTATLRALKEAYPEVSGEFSALLAGDGKTWQSAAPPRWRKL
jgi:hypothetical protein